MNLYFMFNRESNPSIKSPPVITANPQETFNIHDQFIHP